MSRCRLRSSAERPMNNISSLDDSAAASGHVSRDPVCGARVSLLTAFGREEYGGTVYHFCSQTCHERFTAQPESFLTRSFGPE